LIQQLVEERALVGARDAVVDGRGSSPLDDLGGPLAVASSEEPTATSSLRSARTLLSVHRGLPAGGSLQNQLSPNSHKAPRRGRLAAKWAM